jgi:threonylcarbamoyladenosine tRNA methylthiotransferase MtaB
MKYAVVTFGCRVNQADSLAAEEDLRARGGIAADPEDADLVLVNSCSVTASADQGTRQIVRRIARANPLARIVVTGCYATRRPDEIRTLPNVIKVVPNTDKNRLAAMALDAAGLSSAARFGDGDGSCGAPIEPGVAGRTAFTLAVQTGCGEPCAYCIIPETRGAPVSRPVDVVLRQVERATRAGFKEVVLTGVHLGSYGRDLDAPCNLEHLLAALTSTDAARASAVLFRVSSLEPMDCTPAVVGLVADAGSIAPHVHLPLQHASDRVLAAMRRPYTLAQYANLVDGVRARLPHAAIGSDVIVGFPGESDADFDVVVDYLEDAPLSHLHVFPYSDRPGTVASAMAGKVPAPVVRERARRVREISQRLTARFRASQLGTSHRALTLDDGTTAVTGNYLKVRIPPGRSRNEWVDVTITNVSGDLTAEVH